jgi:Cdc6-like AAA superfamily ATPase
MHSAMPEANNSRKAENRKATVNWLGATTATDEFYDSCLLTRLAGACQWVLAAPAFLKWSTSIRDDKTASFLWINGPAGFGKTVLSASLVQHFQASSSDDPVAYFFVSSAAETRDNPLAVVRTWLSQLIKQRDDVFRMAYEYSDIKKTGKASTSKV